MIVQLVTSYQEGNKLGVIKVTKSNSLKSKYPQLVKLFDSKKNGCTPDEIYGGGYTKYWWKCPKGNDHEWKSIIHLVNIGTGCPICVGQKIVKSNSLFTLHPEISKEWHPTKNGDLTPLQVGRGSEKKVWWLCSTDNTHEWITSVNNRTSKYKRQGCPHCSKYTKGRKSYTLKDEDTLKNISSSLSKEWHPTKNGNKSPSNVYGGGKTKYWWKCDKGDDHEWKSNISNRILLNRGCPICSGNKIVKSNCFEYNYPEIMKEWYWEKNDNINPSKLGRFSHKRVWWKCIHNSDHVWITPISKRTTNRGCPFCFLTPQSKEELIVLFELKSIFNDISPKGKKIRTSKGLHSVDMFIPLLKLFIEYDGHYYHKLRRKKDKEKTQDLIDNGYKVIRLREKPLRIINKSDITFSRKNGLKSLVNKTLLLINEQFRLVTPMRRNIQHYISQSEYQNGKNLEKYISTILDKVAD